MFKHGGNEAVVADDKKKLEEKNEMQKTVEVKIKEKDLSPAALRDLLEKNLKWSQIIYEQNRRINNKLLWSAAASWLRLALILTPFVLAIIFLPSIIKDLQVKYNSIFTNSSPEKLQSIMLEQILKILPGSSIEKDQLKAVLNK